MTVTIGMHAKFVVQKVDADGTGTLLAPANLEMDCDSVMSALIELEDGGCAISDIAVSADFGNAEVEISLIATGSTYEDAEATGASCLRSAIHKTGGRTADWTINFAAQTKRTELVVA